MVDIGLYATGGSSRGYLDDRLSVPSASSTNPQALPSGIQEQLTERMFKTKARLQNEDDNVFTRTAKFATSSVIDLGDSLWGNSLNPAGDRGDVWNLVGDYGGDIGRGLESYYQRNQGSIETVSGVGGAVAVAYTGGTLLLPRISNALASTTAINGSRLWQVGRYANVMSRRNMLTYAREAAAKGDALQWRNPNVMKFMANKGMRYAGVGAFEELAIAATMNGNNVIWNDDMSTNMLFAGLGVVAGGALGGIVSKAEIRGIANDPRMLKARANAIDPHALTVLRENQPDEEFIRATRQVAVKPSATLTALAVEANQKLPESESATLNSRLDALKTALMEQRNQQLQKITSKGSKGIGKSGFSVDSNEGTHLKHILDNDPTSNWGLESTAKIGDERDLDVMFIERDADIAARLKSNNPVEVMEGKRLDAQEPRLAINIGWHSAKTPEALAFTQYKPGRIDLRQVPNTFEYRFKGINGKSIKVDESFNVANFAHMHIADQFGVIEAMKRLFKAMGGKTYHLPAKPNWFQIDAAMEFEKNGGQVNWAAAGLVDESSRISRSISLKSDEIGQLPIGSVWERLSYNLPAPSHLEYIYDGAGDTFRSALTAIKNGVAREEAESIVRGLKEQSGFELSSNKATLVGDMWNFNRDSKGNWREPVLGYFEPEDTLVPVNKHSLAEQLMEVKAVKANILMEGDDFVSQLTKSILANPNVIPSMSVRGISDDQITGVGQFVTQLLGEFLTKEMRTRDSVELTALKTIREHANRVSDAFLNTQLARLKPTVEQLNATTAAPSKLLVNQFFSVSSGWDLERIPTPMGSDTGKQFFGFSLKPTERNERRLGRVITKEEPAFMPNPQTGEPMVLDQLGLEFLSQFNNVSEAIRVAKNKVRVAMGLKALRAKEWYVPPPSTKGKYVGFTFDEFGTPVAGGAIVASTASEFRALREAKEKTLPGNYTFHSREEVSAYADLWDRAAMDWIDPSITAAPGKGQTGSLTGDILNPNAISDSLHWIKEQTERLGTDTLRVLYDSQLSIVRARGAAERRIRSLDPTDAAGRVAKGPIRTIWEEYEGTLLNKTAGQMGRSITGAVMERFEQFVDGTLEAVWPALGFMPTDQVGKWVNATVKMTGAKMKTKARSFDELAKQLGPYMPFKSSVEYMEQTYNVKRPPRIRDISDKMNWLASAVNLRYFELPHAAMNLIGIITTMPSIVGYGRAPLLTTIQAQGKRVGVVDSMQILMKGTKDAWKPSRHADWDFMVKNGDTSQQVAEFNKQMSLVSDQSGFEKVFFGSGSKKDKTGLRGKFNESGIDGLISVASDTTENWSRSWSHFIGLRLADHHGIAGMEARHEFARGIANAAIANYSPMNRPELFQSAVGSLYGLYASYMQSFNQRLFRWMEKGDYARIGSQLGMQSALFGLASVPAYKQVESLLLSGGVGQLETGEEATIADHIYARFGPEVGSALMHGGLQELGIVLFTRADMNYRNVTFDPTQIMASIGVLKQIKDMSLETAQNFVATHVTGTSVSNDMMLSEIIARNMPNRMLKGFMAVALNGGLDTDARGQVVSETRGTYETILRGLGLRSTRQQAEIDAFYTDKRLQEREANRMSTLRMETRALLRKPNWEEGLQAVFDKYVKNGGRPNHFRTWIRDQIRAAQSTRGMNSLAKALRSDKSQAEIWRYNAYGALQD